MDMRMQNDAPKPETEAPPPAGEPAPQPKPAGRTTKLVKPLKKPKVGVPIMRSAIAFPYMDLENAISVARAILENGGLPCTREQLAGALKQSPSSGNFILKTAAARHFGLVEFNQGKFHLTQTGAAVLSRDEQEEKAARAQAFLNVALYRRAYDEFRGRQLPPRPHGLEQAFVQFGVSPKQKDVARQVFEKSARQAGFFNVDPDRLIEPIIGPSMGPTGPALERPPEASAETIVTGALRTITAHRTQLDSLVQGLVDRLPPPGEKWEHEKRAKWLRILASNFDAVYTSDDEDKVIVIEVKKLD